MMGFVFSFILAPNLGFAKENVKLVSEIVMTLTSSIVLTAVGMEIASIIFQRSCQ